MRIEIVIESPRRCLECGVSIHHKGKLAKFCSARHLQRWYQRTRYRSDPEYRRRKNAAAVAYQRAKRKAAKK